MAGKVKQPEDKKAPTTARAWKAQRGTDLDVPSGNTALVRMVGPELFLKQGGIPNVLLPYVQDAINDKKGVKPGDLEKMMSTQENIIAAADMLNFICVEACIEPKVHPVPAEGEERDGDLLYADEVDLMDKVFIAQFVMGGTRDLNQFRGQYEATVESLGTQ